MLTIEQVPFYNDVLVFGTTNGQDCVLIKCDFEITKYYDTHFANDIIHNPSWWMDKSEVYKTNDNSFVIMKNYRLAKTKAFDLMKEELRNENNL